MGDVEWMHVVRKANQVAVFFGFLDELVM